MGETYSEIPEYLIEWIKKQHMFWVASAPLTASGHVNVSPKGVANTFHIESPTRVWYEDLSGSGAETIAHIRENGRVTVLFNAFEGPPRIARLFGKGSFHELGSPEYDALLPPGTRQPGSRAVIIVDVYKVGTTCGYSVPYYSFVAHRTPLLDWAAKKEATDLAWSKSSANNAPSAPISSVSSSSPGSDSVAVVSAPIDAMRSLHPNGLLAWWQTRNTLSLDGLTALSLAFRQPPSSLGSHQSFPKPLRQPVSDQGSTSKLQHLPTPEGLVLPSEGYLHLTTSQQTATSSPSLRFSNIIWQWLFWLSGVGPLLMALSWLHPAHASASRRPRRDDRGRRNNLGRGLKEALVGAFVKPTRTSSGRPVRGEEFKEFSEAREASEGEGPPVRWISNGVITTGTKVPLLGYGISFLLGVMFTTFYAELCLAGRSVAADFFVGRTPFVR